MRNYDKEALAAAATEAARREGAHGFRFEHDSRLDQFWIQPAANGAILVSGESPVKAAERFSLAARELTLAAHAAERGEEPSALRFEGGLILVEPAGDYPRAGWNVTQRPALGGEFPLHWHKHKLGALDYARKAAEERGAKLFVAD